MPRSLVTPFCEEPALYRIPGIQERHVLLSDLCLVLDHPYFGLIQHPVVLLEEALNPKRGLKIKTVVIWERRWPSSLELPPYRAWAYDRTIGKFRVADTEPLVEPGIRGANDFSADITLVPVSFANQLRRAFESKLKARIRKRVKLAIQEDREEYFL